LGRLQRWMLFNLTPNASRMRRALAPLRIAQKLGLSRVVGAFMRLMPKSLRQMYEIVPRLQSPRERLRLPELLPAEGTRRARVALLTGCAADAFFPQTTVATARVLQKNGCEVVIPRTQGCCGALHYHAGLIADAQQRAIANLAAFGFAGDAALGSVDAVINNAG